MKIETTDNDCMDIIVHEGKLFRVVAIVAVVLASFLGFAAITNIEKQDVTLYIFFAVPLLFLVLPHIFIPKSRFRLDKSSDAVLKILRSPLIKRNITLGRLSSINTVLFQQEVSTSSYEGGYSDTEFIITLKSNDDIRLTAFSRGARATQADALKIANFIDVPLDKSNEIKYH